jgi:hypothetical protein
MSTSSTSPTPTPNASPTAPTATIPVPASTPTPQPNVSPVPETLSYFSYTIKQAWWPQVDPATVQKWAAAHQHIAQKLDDAADASQHTYVPLFHELLQGKAGDALQTSLAQKRPDKFSPAGALR